MRIRGQNDPALAEIHNRIINPGLISAISKFVLAVSSSPYFCIFFDQASNHAIITRFKQQRRTLDALLRLEPLVFRHALPQWLLGKHVRLP